MRHQIHCVAYFEIKRHIVHTVFDHKFATFAKCIKLPRDLFSPHLSPFFDKVCHLLGDSLASVRESFTLRKVNPEKIDFLFLHLPAAGI